MKRAILVTLAVFLIATIASAAFRQQITVINSSAVTLTDYQVNILLTSAQPAFWQLVKNDGGDIRFEDGVTSANIVYHLQSFNYSAKTASIWVKIPSITANSTNVIYMTFGNHALVSASSIANTWIMYDDFSGAAVDTGIWTVTNSTGVSVSGGNLNMTSTTGRLTSTTLISGTTLLEAKLKYTTEPTNGFTGLSVHFSTSNTFGYLFHPGNDYWKMDSNVYTAFTAAPPAATDLLVKLTLRSDNINTVSCENYSTGVIYNLSPGATKTITNLNVMVGERQSNEYTGQAFSASWDWIRARKTNAPNIEPTVSIDTVSGPVTATGRVVTGSTGLVDVNVTLSNPSTGFSYTIKTGVGGDFLQYPDVAGTMRLTFSKSGYYFDNTVSEFASDGATAVDLGTIRAYPVPVAQGQISNNIFTPGSTDSRYNSLSFSVASNPDSEVLKLRISNSAGALVRELESSSLTDLNWNGKDASGNIPPGGIYIYQFLMGNTTVKKGTLTLIK